MWINAQTNSPGPPSASVTTTTQPRMRITAARPHAPCAPSGASPPVPAGRPTHHGTEQRVGGIAPAAVLLRRQVFEQVREHRVLAAADGDDGGRGGGVRSSLASVGGAAGAGLRRVRWLAALTTAGTSRAAVFFRRGGRL